MAPTAKEVLSELSEGALLSSAYGAPSAHGSSSSGDYVEKATVVPRSDSLQPPLVPRAAGTGDVTAKPANALVVFGPPLPPQLSGNAQTKSIKDEKLLIGPSLSPIKNLLLDVIPFRKGNSRHGQTDAKLMQPNWFSNSDIIKVTLVYPFEGGPCLHVRCQAFKMPENLSEVSKTPEPILTEDGDIKLLQASPYAWRDADTAQPQMDAFIENSYEPLFRQMVNKVAHKLVKVNFDEAYRYANSNPDSLVAQAIKIRVAAYFSTFRLLMDGPGIERMSCSSDPQPLLQGKLPVPPFLDHQIDVLAICYMRKQSPLLMTRLENVIHSQEKTSRWYDLYLTFFVLLQGLESLHQHQLQYQKPWKYDANASARVKFISDQMIASYCSSAKILIYYFNVVAEGQLPFRSYVTQAQRQSRLCSASATDERHALLLFEEMEEILSSRG